MVAKANVLRGMKEISDFAGYSEASLLRMKRQYPGMPMNKPRGAHGWLADPDQLNEFFKNLAVGETRRWLTPKKAR